MERQTEGHSQKDKHINRKTNRQNNRQKNNKKNRKKDRQKDRHINRELREITEGESLLPYIQSKKNKMGNIF